jgi:membrane-associated phospholipid phosphatase
VTTRTLGDLRPADALNFAFLLFLSSLVLVFHNRIEGASFLIMEYAGLIAAQAAVIILRERGGFSRLAHDLIVPVFSIVVVFDSLGKIVHSINPVDIDPLLVRLDYMLCGGNPTVMLERLVSPVLTDILQLSYTSYYFLPIVLGVVLKVRGEDDAFDRSLFFIMLCFYLSYVGYLLWPALGPRFTVDYLQHMELKGLIVARPIRHALNSLEGIKRDAFPSGHTGIALTVLYLAFRYEKRLFRYYAPVVCALIFSTVYLRYHYVVDVIAGVFLAIVTIVIGETYYGYRTKRIDPHR